ncbi:MAG TPA: FtsX-like permease family protein [Candidatus Saccharimonadales bacterium]|nr:FtsX-like permease family protein [Candidatus Saccharimonadales bacterium]
MLFIARKNLFQEKTRFLISIGGVAFSVALIVVLAGLYQGWSNKIGEYIRTVPADVWVMQSGTEELFHTPSVLSLKVGAKIEGVKGVASAQPFNARRVALQVHDHDVNLYIVGYNSGSDVGKPARIVEGKDTPGPGEIIVDKSQKKKIAIGDKIEIVNQELEVVGYAEGGDLVTSSFAFAQKAELNKIQDLPNATNFFAVRLEPGTSAEKAVAGIKAEVSGVDAMTKQEFVGNNVAIISDTFLPVILVLLVIGVAVGVAVIGLTIFTSTIEKANEYGVLKAIGMKNHQLYGVVIQQALIAGVIGYAAGTGLAFLLGATIGQAVPQFVSQIRAIDLVWVFALTLAMSVLAAYIPIRRLSHIDPAEVFRA